MMMLKNTGRPAPSIPQEPIALFLDVDGTLAPIAQTPMQARISFAMLDILKSLQLHLDGALALISGRTVADVDIMTFPLECYVAGQHGIEIRDAAGYRKPDEKQALIRHFSEEIRAFQQRFPQTLVEYKSFGIAIHYRMQPLLGPVIEKILLSLMQPYADALFLQEGKMVWEVKLRGADKGTAIRELMQSAPFVNRMPLFLGDDVTDEYGFKAVNEMGGISVKIGNELTAARYRLKDPAQVQAWLQLLEAEYVTRMQKEGV